MKFNLLASAATGVLAAGALTSSASAATVYAVSSTNNLLTFNSGTPGTIDSSLFITGTGGESILAIDIRPATGQIYGISNGNKVYTINPTTAAATLVGPLGTTLNGTAFGMDFNPTIDRFRIVAETDTNLVVNPITGAIQLVATNLNYAAGDPNAGVNPNVTDIAYTNNFNGATTTQLYGIDTGKDILVTQANNTGVLNTVGALGMDASAVTGFDIDNTGVAYVALMPSGGSVSSLYTLNLVTGGVTLAGQIDGGLNIVDITVAPVPEPTTLAVAAAGLVAMRRRRA